MNKYELALILSPALAEEAKVAEFEKVKDVIVRFGGTVEKVDEWGKRRLAYPIKKCTEGYYSFTVLEAEPTLPAELESRLRIMESVLRYLIISLEA